MLLDLSAAFDTINHDILLKRLNKCYIISGSAFVWIKSYLSNRSFNITVNNSLSEPQTYKIGVPQGSILGPLLFILYIKDLEKIAAKYNFSIHLYADDTQIYFSFDPKDSASNYMTLLSDCFKDIKTWVMDDSKFLKAE